MNTSPALLPERFNFAQHLIELNAPRSDKIAFIDDLGFLRYGELATQVQRMAGTLLAHGVRRDERVLLLMHDNNHWPVAFLGALYAGIVPVAVNTLLNLDDYTYMLRHSRAQAALVSAALLPVLRSAVAQAQHALRAVLVSGAATLQAGEHDIDKSLTDTDQAPAADTAADDPGFWLYSSGSTGKPKGAVHSHANLFHTAQLYGNAVLQLREADVCHSAAKLYFAYGLGNALSFPLSVGATTLLSAARPTPDAVFKLWRGEGSGQQAAVASGARSPTQWRPTVFFGAPTGYAGMLASPDLPARSAVSLRLCSSAGEALPADIGRRFSEHFGCEVIDGIGSTEMLHVYLSNRPGEVRYGSTGKPVPGYDIELRGDDALPVSDGDVGDLYVRGPSAALMYWGQR
ncbi:MAG: benzoate-CoA ligase family protein, partial [Rubrivivax sp.]